MAGWLGAALITAAAVAPAAFEVLPSSPLAGTVVGRVLSPLFVAGIVAGVGVAVLTRPPWAGGSFRATFVAASVVASACGIAQFFLTPRLDRLRAEIGGPVDALAAGDPRRVAFGMLHGYTVAGLALAMAGAGVCLVVLSFAIRPRR